MSQNREFKTMKTGLLRFSLLPTKLFSGFLMVLRVVKFHPLITIVIIVALVTYGVLVEPTWSRSVFGFGGTVSALIL